MYDSLSKEIFSPMGIPGAGLVFHTLFGLAALSLTHAVAVGAESADVHFARETELGGIVLDMGKNAASLQLPSVSGSLAGCVSLVSTSLTENKGQSIKTESETGSFPTVPSAYKKSYYSPCINLCDVNTQWTWSLVFAANEDINLTQTQVAFFSCNKTSLPDSCKAEDFTIRYTLEIEDGRGSLSSFQGTATLSGAAESSEAGYDFATGEITSGSGAMVAVNWPDAPILKQGLTYTYSMTVSNANQAVTGSTGVGFGGIYFSAQCIPEPDSVTLFLIAVAFFASRHRRGSGV